MFRLTQARPPAALAVSVVAVGALVAGCGSDDTATDPGQRPSSPTSSTTSQTTETPTSSAPTTNPAADLPSCSSVWARGNKLPRDYSGCREGGDVVKAQKHPCSFGSSIIEFGNRFYAVAGKHINDVGDLQHNAQFKSAVSACQA